MNDVVIKSGKVLEVGDAKWDIVDRSHGVLFIDMITEARHSNGVVQLSMGAAHIDGQNTPVVQVSTRIRLDIVTAQILHANLGQIIAHFQAPPDKMQTN